MIKNLFRNKKLLILLLLVLVLIILLYLIVLITLKIPSEKKVSQNQTQDAIVEEGKVPVVKESTGEVADDQSTSFSQTASEIESKIRKGTATNEDLMNLGIAYYNLQEIDQAIDTYEDLIAKDPNNSGAYKNLGNIYRDQKKYRDAEASYRKAVYINTKFVTAYINLAHMFFSLENNKLSAVAVLQQGLAYNPEDPTLKDLLDEYSK